MTGMPPEMQAMMGQFPMPPEMMFGGMGMMPDPSAFGQGGFGPGGFPPLPSGPPGGQQNFGGGYGGYPQQQQQQQQGFAGQQYGGQQQPQQSQSQQLQPPKFPGQRMGSPARMDSPNTHCPFEILLTIQWNEYSIGTTGYEWTTGILGWKREHERCTICPKRRHQKGLLKTVK